MPAAMEKLFLKEMKRDFPKLYQQLIVDRNQAWLPEIEKMIADDPIELILVGTLHLTGKDGLPAQLKKRGYKVKKL